MIDEHENYVLLNLISVGRRSGMLYNGFMNSERLMSSFNASTGNNGDCLAAQVTPVLFNNGPMNQDVGGLAIGMANIAINVLLSILFKWSSSYEQTSIFMLLSQVYPILIATAISAASGSLSLFEAHFALIASASPVCIYLAYSAVSDLLGRPNTLFSNMTNGKTLIRCLALLLPMLWLIINLITSFSSSAFKNSYLCKGMEFSTWLEFQFTSYFDGILDVMGRKDLWDDLRGRGGLGTAFLCLLWICGVYFVRHRFDIYFESCAIINDPELRQRQFYQRWPLCLFRIIRKPWSIVAISHPWLVVAMVILVLWNWSLAITKGFSLQNYQLSYGQILSLFSVVPPLVAFVKLLCKQKDELQRFIRSIPDIFVQGLKFLLTGTPNPWDDHRTPMTISPIPWSGYHTAAVILIWLVLSALDIFMIVFYVKAGSQPNPRTLMNKSHKTWKPFSVTLYVFAFFVGCINIYIWTVQFDKLGDARWRAAIFERFQTYYPFCFSMTFRVAFVGAYLILVFPVAFVMCTGPLFAPSPALSLAQQWAWEHACDGFPAQAVLEGTSNILEVFRALNNLSPGWKENTPSTLTPLLQYELVQDNELKHTLILRSTASIFNLSPDVPTTVTYDEHINNVAANCSSPEDNTRICATASFSPRGLLTFIVVDTRTLSTTTIRADAKDWKYTDDAPSYTLRRVEPDGRSGAIMLQTAVTMRNHCDTLKVCLSSLDANADILVPLGLTLLAQNQYAQYCTKPKVS